MALGRLQATPRPGQIPTAKLAIAAAVLAIGAIIYFRFIRKQPPQAQYYTQPQYYTQVRPPAR